MTKLHAQLYASKWVLLLERHQMELDEMRREIEEFVGTFAQERPTLVRWARRPDPPEAA